MNWFAVFVCWLPVAPACSRLVRRLLGEKNPQPPCDPQQPLLHQNCDTTDPATSLTTQADTHSNGLILTRPYSDQFFTESGYALS